MTSRITASLSRTLRRAVSATTGPDVHFHVDSAGRPFVCDYARCDSPGLTTDEAMRVRHN